MKPTTIRAAAVFAMWVALATALAACSPKGSAPTATARTFDRYELTADELTRARALDSSPALREVLADGAVTRDEYATLMAGFAECVNDGAGASVAAVDPGGDWALPAAEFTVDDDTWAGPAFQKLLAACDTANLGQTAKIYKAAQLAAATPPNYLTSVLTCLQSDGLVPQSYTEDNLAADLYYDDPSLTSWDPSVRPRRDATNFNVYGDGKACLDEARN